MKVGSKPNVVETKKVRPCVVRLQKVSPKTNVNNFVLKKSTTGISISKKLSSHEEYFEMNEKMFKGPLKKRPITDGNKTSTLTPNATSKSKWKSTPQREIESPPPTIAASRSRRSIKPNPKYANEDIVTPKTIRATTNVPSTGKKGSFSSTFNKQKEAQYDSSSEDFFNRDTSEESALDEDDDDDVGMLDKPYEIMDSDVSDVELIKNEIPAKKPRGRPKKNIATLSTAHDDPMTNSIVKSSSQLQFIRKSLNNQVNRPSNTSITVKRKLDNSDAIDSISRKRVLLAPTGVRMLKDSQSPDSIEEYPRKSLPVAMTTNTKKLLTESTSPAAVTQAQTAQEQRRTLMAKTLARSNSNISPKGSGNVVQKITTSIPSPQNARPTQSTLQKSAASRVMAVAKRRSASPITTKQTKESKTSIANNTTDDDDPVAASPNSLTDDFESMPTFTIVNINDIINKKGDALISRSSPPPGKTTLPTTNSEKIQKIEEKNKDSNGTATVKLPTITSGKQVRRRGPPPKILAEKQQAEKSLNGARLNTQNAQKKSSPTILNHTLESHAMKQARQARGSAANRIQKPAPRILNSMVAKKTDPVKPLIANLDDSADESFPLSMDENESEDDDLINDKSYDSSTDLDRASNKSKTTKNSVPAAKENSSAITNCISNSSSNSNNNVSKLSMINSTPEKVVIQRQGDKIIKKVTCFENWYVLNIPDEKPPEPVRNLLEMPLIKLANITEDITLPTASWTAKVTLYELSASTLASSTLITYTGDLCDPNIAEEDRAKYQPSCVMFRRSVAERTRVRLPYDRAVIFKNKTFFTNIEGKNVKLVGAPNTISNQEEVEILLEIVNDLTLDSTFVEPATTTQ